MEGNIDFDELMEDAFKTSLQIVKRIAINADDNAQIVAASNLALPLFNAKAEEIFHIMYHMEHENEDPNDGDNLMS